MTVATNGRMEAVCTDISVLLVVVRKQSVVSSHILQSRHAVLLLDRTIISASSIKCYSSSLNCWWTECFSLCSSWWWAYTVFRLSPECVCVCVQLVLMELSAQQWLILYRCHVMPITQTELVCIYMYLVATTVTCLKHHLSWRHGQVNIFILDTGNHSQKGKSSALKLNKTQLNTLQKGATNIDNKNVLAEDTVMQTQLGYVILTTGSSFNVLEGLCAVVWSDCLFKEKKGIIPPIFGSSKIFQWSHETNCDSLPTYFVLGQMNMAVGWQTSCMLWLYVASLGLFFRSPEAAGDRGHLKQQGTSQSHVYQSQIIIRRIPFYF